MKDAISSHGSESTEPRYLGSGLMWHPTRIFFDQQRLQENHVVHSVSGSGVDKFGWKLHDGSGFGVENIQDNRNNLNISVEFVSTDCENNGSSDSIGPERAGQSFGLRVGVSPLVSSLPVEDMTFVFYFYVYDNNGDGTSSLKVQIPKKAARKGLSWSDDPSFQIAVQPRSEDNSIVGKEPISFQLSREASTSQSSFPPRFPSRLTAELNAGNEALDFLRISSNAQRRLPDFSRIHFAGVHDAQGVRECDPARIYSSLLAISQKKLAHRVLSSTPRGALGTWEMMSPQFSSLNPVAGVLPNNFEKDPTFFALQIPSKIDIQNALSFSINVRAGDFSSSSSSHIGDGDFDEILRLKRSSLLGKFDSLFFGEKSKFALKEKHAVIEMVSNMLGGASFSTGRCTIKGNNLGESLADAGNAPESLKRFGRMHSLFTFTPSRSVFPRGFLWDEGFHLLLVSQVDLEKCMASLSSWLCSFEAYSMFPSHSRSGWIPREQILGCESRRLVPSEFIPQIEGVANPPALLLAIDSLLNLELTKMSHQGKELATALNDAVAGDGHNPKFMSTDDDNDGDEQEELKKISDFLSSITPQLLKWHQWYLRTHSISSSSECSGFVWEGRSGNLTLSSGLDDYPRTPNASTPRSASERHVDLFTWMIALTKVVQRLGSRRTTAETQSSEFDEQEVKAMLKCMIDLHWDDSLGLFADVYDRVRVTEHVGYVSFYPLFLDLLDPVEHEEMIMKLLNNLRNESLLWSKFGIRSLSLQDDMYGKDENYWRGSIWIPMNYLAVRSLFRLSRNPISPIAIKSVASEMYESLRKRLVLNVIRSIEKRGSLSEQFDPRNGAGLRGQHFTGWSALIVLMMLERFP